MKEPKIRRQIHLITSQQVCAVLLLSSGNPQFGGLKTAQAPLKVSPAVISPQAQDGGSFADAITLVGGTQMAPATHRHTRPRV